MNIVIVVCGVVLTLASFGTVYRIFRGPTLLDRVLATDVLLAIFVAAICVNMVARDSYESMLLLVVASTIGFVGSVTVARYADNSPSGEKKLKPSRLQEVNRNDPRSIKRAEQAKREAAARKAKKKQSKKVSRSEGVTAAESQQSKSQQALAKEKK